MSTPMFVREPKIGSSRVTGQALDAEVGSSLFLDVDEATLVEKIVFGTRTDETQAGQLLLVHYSDYTDLTTARLVAAIDIPAGAADVFLTHEETVDITIPVGGSLYATHNVKDSGGSYIIADITAHGGVVR